MWQRNNGDENNALQNQFTAYLITAVRNRRITYLRRLSQRLGCEQSLESEDLLERVPSNVDFMLNLTLLQQIENEQLHDALKQIRERERYIFLSRALEERTFEELAGELDMSYGAVAMTYYRTIARIKKAMGG